jgi:hypothetical protein
LYSVVSDVTVSASGLLAAALSVLATCGQQVGVAGLLKKYEISSVELISQVFPLQVNVLRCLRVAGPRTSFVMASFVNRTSQALSLLLCGPFLDEILCGSFPTSWGAAPGKSMLQALSYLVLSCSLAVLVNYSQVRTMSLCFKLSKVLGSDELCKQFKCISAMSPTGAPFNRILMTTCVSHSHVCRFPGARTHKDSVGTLYWLVIFWRNIYHKNSVRRESRHGGNDWLREINRKSAGTKYNQMSWTVNNSRTIHETCCTRR